MNQPIKHAPGVVCIIRAPRGNMPPKLQELWDKVTGKTGTIVALAGSSFTLKNGQVCWFEAVTEPIWLVEMQEPIEFFVDGRYTDTVGPFRQSRLIPIAGPGIGVDEETKQPEPEHETQ